jgi:hypothetical protein
MVAESLIRILDKRRADAIRQGTFFVQLLGRKALSVAPQTHLPVHDLVLQPLLARAVECRVYGVRPQSKLHGLVSQLGHREQRVWHLDLSKELLHGFEPLWNSHCEHSGIVLKCRMSFAESQPILAQCGRPDAWGSRYQLCQGTSKAAVSYCFEIAQASGAYAFLLPGSNGLEWMDVFANRDALPVLWEQALFKR